MSLIMNSPVSGAETGLFATYQVTLQSFFMGFLFFIAGYFVPAAYDSKGPGRFLRDRAFRLGLPLLFFVFILQPVAIYCIGLFHGEDVAPDGFTGLYRWYIRSGHWLGGTGPLWFCEALLIFCLVYAVFRRLRGKNRPADAPEAAAGTAARSSGMNTFPGKARIWGLIVLIAVLTFLVRFPWPNGTSFYNLQFCYFSQYVAYFAAGTLAFRGGWLDQFTTADGKYWGRAARFFSANAFAVYVFHTPILIAISRLVSPVQAPLLLKFLFLTIVSILVSYTLCSLLFRKLPLLRRIL